MVEFLIWLSIWPSSDFFRGWGAFGRGVVSYPWGVWLPRIYMDNIVLKYWNMSDSPPPPRWTSNTNDNPVSIHTTPGKGLHHIAYKILSYLDAKSLCRAELVCNEWYRVIEDGLLWKKLIERKVAVDTVWKGLSERRGWDKYLFRHVAPSEGITNQFYRQLYPSIIKDIEVCCTCTEYIMYHNMRYWSRCIYMYMTLYVSTCTDVTERVRGIISWHCTCKCTK